jgi:bacterioferritin
MQNAPVFIEIYKMLHVEALAEQIFFLGGDVLMKASDEVKIVKDVEKMLDMARTMEEQSSMDYNRWANECSANADSVSKKLFEQLVIDEERHYDQYDNEIANLKRFGKEYLALQSIERSKARRAIAGSGAA